MRIPARVKTSNAMRPSVATPWSERLLVGGSVWLCSNAKASRPFEELKGFARVELQPGESRRVSINLDRRALSYWDVAGKAWKVDPGKFKVYVGDSSANVPLQADFTVR